MRLGVSGRTEAYPCLLEKRFSGGFTIRITCLLQQHHVDICGGGEHDGVVEQQTYLAVGTIVVVGNVKERVQVHQWHVRMNKFGVGLKKRILEQQCR